jgi:hypothetical protein
VSGERFGGSPTGWEPLCRRTDDPKLAYIEEWLDLLGIPHRRNGRSYHAPILEVAEEDHDRAYQAILMCPTRYGIFDDIPDNHYRFVLNNPPWSDA